MKKLESTLPNMAIVLTLISVIAGGILAYVNNVTAGPIEEIKAKTLADGIKKVLCETELNVQKTDSLLDEKGKVSAIVYTTDKGVAVQALDGNAFGGTLKVLVGFDNAGKVKGYEVLESAETPGLGAKAAFWFQAGEKGNIIGLNPGEKELTVSKDGGQVDAITASTITSRAFLRAVNAAYKAFSSNGKVDAESGATKQAEPKSIAADSVACDSTELKSNN